MNKFIPLLLTLPMLIGCQTTNEYHEYTGEKIVLDYVENGALLEITASELYTNVKNSKSMICLLSIPSCGGCKNVKRNLEAYATGSHCNMHYIDMTKTLENNEEKNKLTLATEGYYQWGEKESYPLVYFFFKGDVAFRCGEEDVTTFISNYVEVADATN